MEKPIVLLAELVVPEEREVGRVAGRKKVDVRGVGELCEE